MEKRKDSEALAKGDHIIGNCLIHESASVSPEALLGPNVVIGPKTIVEPGARIANSCVLSGSLIKSHAWIKDCIIGWDNVIGKWCRIEGISVFGEDVKIQDELFVNSSIVLPHKVITQSVFKKGTILM